MPTPSPRNLLSKTAAFVLFVQVMLLSAGNSWGLTTNTLHGTLTEGSLSGTVVNVSFSYDESQIDPSGDSWIGLASFDFTLLGVPFRKQDIFQGGQVIFRKGRLDNVTASFQVLMPAGSPVKSITFGFGGPGVIGYIDQKGVFGTGAFTISPGCALRLSPDVSRIGADGSNAVSVSLSGSFPQCPWTVAATAPWVAVDRLSGTGDTTLTLYVYPNFGTTLRTASLVAGGPTAYVSQSASGGTADERFVRLVYFAFLGRLPSAAETAFQVSEGVGRLGRAAVAANLFSSAEFNAGGRFVAGLYFGLLGRVPEYGGWLFQRNALALGAVDRTALVRNFLDSAEFVQAHPGLTDAGFVRLLYSQILLREPTQAEVDFQTSAGLAGGRAALASRFLTSAEFAQKLGPPMTAFLLYAALLGRDPARAELDWRAAQIRQGSSVARLVSDFVAAPEFAAQFQ